MHNSRLEQTARGDIVSTDPGLVSLGCSWSTDQETLHSLIPLPPGATPLKCSRIFNLLKWLPNTEEEERNIQKEMYLRLPLT